MSTADLEDGEILSDEDETVTEKKKTETFEAYSVVERPDRSKYVAAGGYRSSSAHATHYSSDEDKSDNDSDNDGDSPVKKPRMGHVPDQKNTAKGGYKQDPEWLSKAHQNIVSSSGKGKKPNNIWGSVLEEENMSLCVNQLNRNEKISYERGAESYDYTRSALDPRFEKASESSESSSEESEEEEGPADLTAKETFGFDIDKKPSLKSRLGNRKSSSNSSEINSGRSRSVSVEKDTEKMDSGDDTTPMKNRHKYRKRNEKHSKNEFDARQKIKGKNKDKRNESNEMDIDCKNDARHKIKGKKDSPGTKESGDLPDKVNRKRRFHDKNAGNPIWHDIDKVELKPMKFNVKMDTDMQDLVLVDTMLDALREPPEKMDLFLRIIDQIGAEKTIKAFKATEDVEEMGGMMIQNGMRRRTPGGVFLFMIREDSDITQEQQDIMFAEERELYKQKQRAEKKERQRRSRQRKRQSQENRGNDVKEGTMDTGEDVNNGQNSVMEMGQTSQKMDKDSVTTKELDAELQEYHEAINIELS